MKPRTRMRTPTAPTHRTEWKVIVIDDESSAVFGTKFEEALQMLTETGFQIVNQMTRGSALIITAHRHHPIDASAATIPAPEPRRRIVEVQNDSDNTHREVLYNFLVGEDKTVCQRVFTNLQEALRMLSADLARDDILPVGLVLTSLTTFEPSDFPALLSTYAENIHDLG